ncbi:MAG: hypothetical protein KJ799_17745 [Bacteroidetes bacterium]|nr:hypothetical protein [Bacteroidota bacterium]MBU1679499.1 hypothetical protein [Bacteroidota bacterium]MBU2508542.1 hypothetical protein [Bacteroidota bacterium]
MSFYPQPNKYQCGPFALKYALVMLGVFKNENQIGIIAGSTWWAGTDEIGLSRAARRFNCKLVHFHSTTAVKSRQLLSAYLRKGIPCLLSVHNWEHWITVINCSRGNYIMIDSGRDTVVNIINPQQLNKLWRYHDEEGGITSYDGYALIPKFKVHTRAKMDLKKAHELMFESNKNLASRWNEYFNDVLNISKPRTALSTNYITFREFLRRNQKNIVKKVANWHGDPTYAELIKILNNMKFIAEVYDLIIPIADEKKALIDVTAILTIYSCGKYGMDSIYE